jgi:hypothetical protein
MNYREAKDIAVSCFKLMKNTHYFEVTALIDQKIERAVIEGFNSRDVKFQVEQNWRENQMYDHKVIKITPSTVSDYEAYWNSIHNSRCDT